MSHHRPNTSTPTPAPRRRNSNTSSSTTDLLANGGGDGMSEFADVLSLSPKTSVSIVSSNFTEDVKSTATAKDVTDFVKGLLQEAGADQNVDFNALRRELESSTMSHIQPTSAIGKGLDMSTMSNAGPDVDDSFNPKASFLQNQDVSGAALKDLSQNISIATAALVEAAGNALRGVKSDDEEGDQDLDRLVQRLEAVRGPIEHRNGAQKFNTETAVFNAVNPITGDVEQNPLSKVSALLESSGFPSLPVELITAPVTHAAIAPISSRHVSAFNSTIQGLLREHAKRSDLIQHMLSDRAAAEERITQLEAQLKSRDDAIQQLNRTDVVRELQEHVETLRDKTKSLTDELLQSRKELSEVKSQNTTLKRQLADRDMEIERLSDEARETEFKTQKTREQTERTISQLIGKSSKSERIDNLTLEIVDVYEKKIDDLNNDMKRLEDDLVAKAQEAAESRRKLQEIDVEREMREFVREVDVTNPDERLTRVLSKQIREMKKELDETKAQLRKSQEECELTKVQLLSYKKPAWVDKINGAKGQRLSTRELIVRDKLAHQLQLHKIDALDPEDLRSLVKEICIKLSISDVEELLVGLENVEKVLKLVPQMQNFIKQADSIVWGYKDRLFGNGKVDAEGLGKDSMKRVMDVPPHKLKETLQELDRWAHLINQVEAMKDFRIRVHELVGVQPSHVSNRACLGVVRRLAAGGAVVKPEPNAESELLKMVNYFRDLFDVGTLEGVFPKMNELFVIFTETDAGVKRLRKVLGYEESIDSGKVLMKAADMLANYMVNAPDIIPSRAPKPTATMPTRAAQKGKNRVVDKENAYEDQEQQEHMATSSTQAQQNAYEQDEELNRRIEGLSGSLEELMNQKPDEFQELEETIRLSHEAISTQASDEQKQRERTKQLEAERRQRIHALKNE